MANYGFIRVAAASPKMRVADPVYNTEEIKRIILAADASETAVIVLPELCITGYTCADLFGQKLLLEKSLDCLHNLINSTENTGILALVGLPLPLGQRLYNCAVAFQNGRILGVVPKTFPANYKEFYENRWFSPGQEAAGRVSAIRLQGQEIPFGNLIFRNEELDLSLGIEICEDLWAVIPPSSYMALNGANIIANLSASNDLVSKSSYRRQLVAQQSARCICGYIYASSGIYESSTDIVFGGDCVISENGHVLETSQRFSREGTVIYSEIDVERLAQERQMNKTYAQNYGLDAQNRNYRTVMFKYEKEFTVDNRNFKRKVHPYPFIPGDDITRDERCEEIFNIQVAGLTKRLDHTGIRHAVIGVSGGLDSTLALLITERAFKVLGIPAENIHAITMPGFGTTGVTYNNALHLMKSMKVNISEISIQEACLRHFKDIGQPVDVHDITFENAQARERTQILMDMANKIDGLVIGTGDLSELALGWATYNGDHMSMYAVNCSVPKTLVRFLVKWIAENEVGTGIKEVLHKILKTPISPELLPPDENGNIKQKTEEVVGPYELHDFFLYHVVRHGMPPRKVLLLAEIAFAGTYDQDEIRKWLKVFYRRFFSQQFKRSCLPDGPKVGTISLSPRGDWRMPSDAEVSLWLDEL